MLENNKMATTSTEVTSIQRRNKVEKFTWRNHRYFVDFESRMHVEISKSNRCHNFHVDSPFKIDVVSTIFPRGISTSNRWRFDKDVSIQVMLIQSFHSFHLREHFQVSKIKTVQYFLVRALFQAISLSVFARKFFLAGLKQWSV